MKFFREMIFLLLVTNFNLLANDLFISDVQELIRLEDQGFNFSKQIGAKESFEKLDMLYDKNISYKFLVDTLAHDLNKIQNASPHKQIGPSMKFPYRLFNSAWLKSSKSFFELAGVVKREDRAFRHSNICGEVRLIFRLAYDDVKIKTYSRLPMTVMFVYKVEGACLSDTSIIELLKKSALHDIELNFQSLRWPSSMRPDMGGYAEYMMRVFEFNNGQLKIKLLDNTIDLNKLKNNSALRSELLTYLSHPDNIKKVDEGSLILDAKFLANSATSVAVHGLNRLANRSYDQIFTEADFKELNFKNLGHIKSAKGYLRKLNESTCIGCHQSRSIAGFHFLGNDRTGSIAFNKVLVPFSDHFLRDQLRRKKYVASSLNPNLGFIDHSVETKGAKNDRCFVGADASFKEWKCAAGLKCEAVGSAPGIEYFGICQEEKKALAGDACFFGRVGQSKNSKYDREKDSITKDCLGELNCLQPFDGYPGGYCFANFCDPKISTKSCAALAVGGFNPCLASGKPFRECLEKFTGSIEAGECDLDKPCRDDFICAEGYAGKGVCAPPYSLFQLRVDGHSLPL